MTIRVTQFGPRSRLGREGFHIRRRERFASSHFFPRSVGFGPTASRAIGAFTMAPSMLCHDHAIPSISSYSANPLRQSFTKTPFFFHSRKYLCPELALPNSDLGKAFHWHPVRKTYTMASSTLRGSMGFRPPPGAVNTYASSPVWVLKSAVWPVPRSRPKSSMI